MWSGPVQSMSSIPFRVESKGYQSARASEIPKCCRDPIQRLSVNPTTNEAPVLHEVFRCRTPGLKG